jgi:hypothetical protein
MASCMDTRGGRALGAALAAPRCGFLGAQVARAGSTLISDAAGMPNP